MNNKIWSVITVLLIVSLAVGGLMVFGAGAGDAAVYFPLKPGNTWTYKLSMVGGTQAYPQRIKVSEPENGNPKVIVYDPNNNPRVFIYYVENEQGLLKAKEMGASGMVEYQPLWLVLGSKMEVGSSWSWESGDHKMKESGKVMAAEKVTVEAGTFDTVLVQYEGVNNSGDHYLVKSWFAKGVGYVKEETTHKGQTYVSELVHYVVN